MSPNSSTKLPLVTIMIPTYGQEDIVLAAIDSALSQDYPNLEIIVADDASPDNTCELIVSRKDPRLHYHRNAQNLGRVANYRNTLYNLATGDWVVNLDGDDSFIDSNFISKAIEVAYSEPGIVIVSARQRVVTASGTREPLPLVTTILSGKETLLRYHEQRYHFSHLATMYHRSSALACDFYRMDVISSDLESLLRLALKGKVVFLDRVVGCWNLLGGNASLNNSWKDLANNLKIWESIYLDASSDEMPQKALERARYVNLLSVAYRDLSLIFKEGSVLGAIKYLHDGFPILKTPVILRIIVHPYLWAKFGINIYKHFMQRIAC
jgi:glycosyltransferase involved in cell wall biosynthesis